MTSAGRRGYYIGSLVLLFGAFVYLKRPFSSTTVASTQPFSQMSPGSSQPFFEYVHLPDNLLPTYVQVKKQASQYVVQDKFNWNGFKSFVDNADDSQIALDGLNVLPIKLQGDNANVATLVNRVMELLPSLVPQGAIDKSQMRNNLTSVFHDLDGLWHGQMPSDRLSKEYRALVGTPASQSEQLKAYVATVTAEGHCKKETSWGGMFHPKVTKDGSVSVKVMSLVVVKGFTA